MTDDGPIKDEGYRPPTLRGMFDRSAFDASLSLYPRAHWIMSDVRTAARSPEPIAFEVKLAELERSPDSDIRHAVTQVPLALQHYFDQVSRKFTNQPVNYSALLARLLNRGMRVAFATLNYDTLMEQSVAASAGHQWEKYGNIYAAHDRRWQVAKLHGSVDWGYPWYEPHSFRSPVEALANIGPPVAERDKIEHLPAAGALVGGWLYYPAIALPVAGKYGFVCRQEVEDELATFTRECDACIFIGFSGQDEDVRDFLSANLTARLRRIDVVAYGDADAVRQRLMQVREVARLYHTDLLKLHDVGFTRFMETSVDDVLAWIANGDPK